jgi:hypothetical protein
MRTCASEAVVAMKARNRLTVLKAASRAPAKHSPLEIDDYLAKMRKRDEV